MEHKREDSDPASAKPRDDGARSGHDAHDPRRDAIARRLCALICTGSLDEIRALDVICARVFGVGRDNYGPTRLATDARDFRKEAADEFADALWYMALDVVRRNDERLERLRCDVADELLHEEPTR